MGQKSVFALLVQDTNKPLDSLKVILKGESVETWSAETCEDVAKLLDQTQPELVITQTMLPDGSWVDIVSMAEKAASPTNVIVVGSHPDIGLYISAIEGGAFDFILPPFETEALRHVLRAAVDNVRYRREAQSSLAVA